MILCSECVKYCQCKEICPTVKKEITGRGKTASRKPKTYPVDFSYIDSRSPLNPFQIEVLNTITELTLEEKEKLITQLEIEEAINQSLNGKEKDAILFFMQNFKQRDIAKRLNISQPRVNFLLLRAFRKLKLHLLELSK
jgi:RNA polymerase sigma factor (sigma-70 family)